jgi:hypothetical protein
MALPGLTMHYYIHTCVIILICLEMIENMKNINDNDHISKYVRSTKNIT